METTKIEFTRVNNDVNGNPRYVCSFLSIPLSDGEKSEINKRKQALTDHRDYYKHSTSLEYELALKKAKKIGGKKFHNKQYGGGIVFQSYNIRETEQDILNLLK